MPAVTLVGATGLTGSQALAFLLASPANFSVTALTRRAAPAPATPPPAPGATYTNDVLPDLGAAQHVAHKGGVYVSCLGTTRALAGGADKQVLVDRDLNAQLADKAKADGADTVSELPPALPPPAPFAFPLPRHRRRSATATCSLECG